MDKMLKAHYSVVMNAVYEHDNGEIVGHVVSFDQELKLRPLRLLTLSRYTRLLSDLTFFSELNELITLTLRFAQAL